MEPITYPRLLGDIGGTNARFAWLAAPGEPLSDVATLPAADHPSLEAAMRRYLDDRGGQPPRWGAIGIANPLTGDLVKMTNHHWSFSIEAVRRALGLERFVVINDFTALALALPAIDRADFRAVGGGLAVADAPLALIGPGTGLGVSGLWPARPGRPATPIDGEGGHVTLAPTNDREEQVIRQMRGRFGHVSAERAVSGMGLVNLYEAVCAIEGVAPDALDAAAVSARATAGQDAQCRAALDLFFAFLGNVAGNLALSLGARGGVVIGGGIVPRLGDEIDRSAFRARFEAKGRFQAYLEAIPTFVLNSRVSPALLGAARALEDL